MNIYFFLTVTLRARVVGKSTSALFADWGQGAERPLCGVRGRRAPAVPIAKARGKTPDVPPAVIARKSRDLMP